MNEDQLCNISRINYIKAIMFSYNTTSLYTRTRKYLPEIKTHVVD